MVSTRSSPDYCSQLRRVQEAKNNKHQAQD
jgi:hypothetical protein